MTAGAKPTTEPEPQLPDNAGDGQTAEPSWRKIGWLAVVAGILLAIVYLSPLREYLGRLREVSGYIRSLGPLAPLAVAGSVAVLVAAGFPRLVFCVIAGMALGFWSGLLWAQLGTLLGNYVVFLAARFWARDWAQRRLAKRDKVQSAVRREGIAGVVLARQLPVPGLLVNLALGLLSIRQRDFLIGTVIGQLPEAIPCTLIGAGALKTSFAQSAGLIGVAVALAVIVWAGLRWYLRRPALDHEAGENGQ